MAITAKLVPAVFAGILAGMPLASIAQSAAGTTDSCLTQPRQDTPAGEHWYYRIEHGTGRHCWYLREGGGRAQSASSAKPEQQPDAASSRSIADARDEMPMPQAPHAQSAQPPRAQSAAATVFPPVAPVNAQPSAPTTGNTAANAPDAGNPQSLISTRWPNPSVASSPVTSNSPASVADNNPAPAMTGAAADAEAAQQAASQDPAPAPTAAAAPALAKVATTDSAAPQAADSLQKLLIVILGALALAGITASVVFRLSRARQRAVARQRKDTIWESAGNKRHAPWVEPQIEAPAVADSRQAHDRRISDSRGVNQPAVAEDPVERIEEFLTRLTRQLQAELDKSPEQAKL